MVGWPQTRPTEAGLQAETFTTSVNEQTTKQRYSRASKKYRRTFRNHMTGGYSNIVSDQTAMMLLLKTGYELTRDIFDYLHV